MGKYQLKLLMLFNLAFLMKCKYYPITAKYNTFMFDNSVLVRTFSTGLQGFNGEVYLRHLKIFTVVGRIQYVFQMGDVLKTCNFLQILIV